MPNKELSFGEITNVLASAKERVTAQVIQWPGLDNLKTIAWAVEKRKKYVTLDDNKRYVIDYRDHWQAIFIKPDYNSFAPCGYISYDKLKGLLEDDGE